MIETLFWSGLFKECDGPHFLVIVETTSAILPQSNTADTNKNWDHDEFLERFWSLRCHSRSANCSTYLIESWRTDMICRYRPDICAWARFFAGWPGARLARLDTAQTPWLHENRASTVCILMDLLKVQYALKPCGGGEMWNRWRWKFNSGLQIGFASWYWSMAFSTSVIISLLFFLN